MVCQNNRTIKTGSCPRDDSWETQTYPYNGKCEHLFAIPNEYNSNGYMPSCKGVTDGTYLTTPVRCDVFYPCFNGTAYSLRCPNGLVFDVTLSTWLCIRNDHLYLSKIIFNIKPDMTHFTKLKYCLCFLSLLKFHHCDICW